jgi:hypothetical protein
MEKQANEELMQIKNEFEMRIESKKREISSKN